ncbi:ATP-dependent RNA helicase DDX24 [Papilio machaon]|uniref:ATP-dependent RNA helicase DDX24 n=1 Tax=Papilio machaon TaxID=76193 RepID=UPI001E664035|nr:ATP-dependent RNA helicase DDX24 [Papilio machaon]
MSKKLKTLKWESVPMEGFPVSMSDKLQGFVGLEECTEYGLDRDGKKSKKKKTTQKQKSTNKTTVLRENTLIPNKKVKLENGFTVEVCDIVKPSLTNDIMAIEKKCIEKSKENQPRIRKDVNIIDKKKESKPKKRKLGDITETCEKLTPEDMLSWAEFKLPEEIINALAELGFKNPTKIQQLTLPAAIHGRRDILGAAETGSGKTLAFGLPILSGIMKLKEKAEAGLNVYEIPYKKTSVKRKVATKEKVKKNGKNKKKKTKNTEETSEGYSSGEDSENGKENVSQEEEFIEEIEVPIRKKEISLDEGNDSDEDYVHLSEMIDSEDLAESSDDEADRVEVNENDGEETDGVDEVDENGIGCVKVIDDVEMPGHVEVRTGKPLYALILTPTRELAIQISRHLIAAAKYTGIKVATIVGGMASVKQERVLHSGPEVVVATPGRLWELVTQGQPHLQQLSSVKFLAVDETDRMIERGHFEELQPLLERLNDDEAQRSTRQNFVFSATLTLVHDLPVHMKGKKVTKRGKIINRKIEKMTSQQKIKRLITMIGMTDPKVVDITTENLGAAETLTECRIACALENKDSYLYYILKRHPGRTIVFCNSIGSVRRLAQLFTLLKCSPLPLHASMPQRQRLKNLERFRDDPHGVLMATDVAARGLDIPDVDHVVHYQVPKTAENYVHRSGRTARATKEGLTILMMDSSEAYTYAKLRRTLNKTTELPTFPVDERNMSSIRDLVKLGREIDALLLRRRRGAQAEGWREKAAREMDIIIDDDDVPRKEIDPSIDKTLNIKKKQLESLLSRPMFPKGFSFKFPTLNTMEPEKTNENALQVMKKAIETGAIKKEMRKSKNEPLLKLQKKFKK